ncbi:TPA: hypothetical protein ACH3X2_010867 [Trebouxia sp. C0005]
MKRLTLQVCILLTPCVVLGQVIVGRSPTLDTSPVVNAVSQIIADSLSTANLTAAAAAVSSSANGNADILAQILTASIEQADASYAANHTSGPPYTLLGAPYRPYNHTAAAVRAATLGQAISQAAVPSPVQTSAYAEAFTQSFLQQNSPFQGLYGGFTVATAMLIAAQAANDSQAFDQMFAEAKAANVSVSDVATVLSTTAGSPPPVGGPAALIAANKAYGATAAALANVSGNATAVAALISASVTLDVSQQDVVAAVLAGNNETLALLQDGQADDTTNATAANIADAIGTANLASQVAAQALEVAIAQAVEDPLQADPGIIIQAAILSNNSQAVMPGFIMARAANATLNDACNSQLVAQAVSTAAGHAAAQAVSAVYGTTVNCSASN